jgi:transcription elongation factor Elf1
MIPEINYPSYDVITPQTLLEYKLRCLTVNDELDLKASIIDPDKVLKQLSLVLYRCIISKPEEVKNYNDWLSVTTLEDEKALVYALFQATYGDDITINHVCPHCGSNNVSDVKISKGIKIVNYPKEGRLKVLEDFIDVDLPISKWKVKIKVPTLTKALNISNDYSKDVENLEQYLLYITDITIDNKSIDISNKNDLMNYIKVLPSKDRKSIDESIKKFEESNGSINCSYRITCKNCGGKYSTNVNFVEQLFRSL